MKLSTNFTLAQFEKSLTAERKGIDNICTNLSHQANLKELCLHVLQPIREHYGKAVRVNSGYRCADLNKQMNKGKDKPSQHRRGEAADIEIMGVSNYKLAVYIHDNLPFDQLILENHTAGDPNSGWVHVSFCLHKARKSVLTATFKKGKATYHKGLLV